MQKGRILKFCEEKGFGFIAPDDRGENVHFRREIVSGQPTNIPINASVEFETKRDTRSGKITAQTVVITGSLQPPQRPSSSRQREKDLELPSCCVFDSFYVNGFQRREIFIEAADKMANLLENTNVTRTSVRKLFNLLKATEQEITFSKEYPVQKAAERFYKFHRLVTYNNKRKISGEKPLLPDIFKRWVDEHLDVATKNCKEFVGFFEYLTSIMARLKEK